MSGQIVLLNHRKFCAMTIEQAKRVGQLIRQVRETLKTAVNELSEIAENALAIFTDDEITSRNSPQTNVERRLFNKNELAERLGVCPRILSDLLNEGMPYVQIKTRIQFDYDDVLIWLKNRKVG